MARSAGSQFNIGAVARLSGVSREKIRIWERRYGAVTPARDAGNNRLYSRTDVERLTLIRGLVDRGQAISSVANLTLAQLKERAGRPGGNRDAPGALPDSALVVSPGAAEAERLLADLDIGTVCRVRDPAAAEAWLEDQSAELVLVEVPTLRAGDLPDLVRLRRLAPRSRLLLVYRFAARAQLEQLRTLDIHPVKAPLQADDLGYPGPAADADAPGPRARRYTPAQLHRIAAHADRMLCECPRHLVDLVSDLNAFEDYSLGCEVDSAADAVLHREIYAIVSRARTLVEDALNLVDEEARDG